MEKTDVTGRQDENVKPDGNENSDVKTESDRKEKQDKKMEQKIKKNEKKKEKAPGKKKSKKRIIIAAVVIILIVIRLVSCAMTPEMGAAVTVTTAERGDLQESISTSGNVVSEEIKVIFSPVNGRLAEVAVAAGDAVKAGDVLVSYDMDEMEKMLRQAALQQTKSNAAYMGAIADNSENQSKLTEADVNLSVLERQIEDNKAYLRQLQTELKKSQRETGNDLAEDNYNLNKELGELQLRRENLASVSGGDAAGSKELDEINTRINEINSSIARNSYLQTLVSSSDYVAELEQEIADVQERIADYQEYKARMDSQKNTSENVIMDSYDREQQTADNELAKMSYEEAEKEYYSAKQGINAEFDGIVTECNAIEGSTVTDGTQLLKLESSENVKVTFYASKHDVEKLEEGQKAEVTISGSVYQGEISKINRMASRNESSTPMVGVEVHLLDPDDKIILGLDAKLIIYTKNTTNALLIPVEAVNADRDGDFLYVVEDGKAVRRPIVCGISTDTYTEVIEGITEEDQIVLTSYTTLEEGMPVTIIPQ